MKGMETVYRHSCASLIIIVSLLTLTAIAMFSSAQELKTAAAPWLPVDRTANRMTADGYPIDIKEISVLFDYFPESHYTDCKARVEFVMQPGHTRPLIHFDPVFRYAVVPSLLLNGESLDFTNSSDVRILEYQDSTQDALEFQRDLQGGVIHVLEIFYWLPRPELYPRFSTEVNDLEGRGNEEIFPTINSPHEFARHRLTFRVHGTRAFRCLGSGHVTRTDPVRQEWLLDTERAIASYSVMFILVPEEDTLFEQRTIGGVDVRIVAFIGGASIPAAFDLLTPWLPELSVNLGPFPMPRGLSIFLVSSGGGMEYYGGTITSLWALNHEVFHMYYACSTVMTYYRDTWLDEAAVMWYGLSRNPSFSPIDSDYRSNIVSGRPPLAVGFDRRAYDEGARILEAVARELGGRDAMIAFLSHVHRSRQFQPFTTWEFLDMLEAFSGLDMRDRFSGWLYQNEESPPVNRSLFRHTLKASDLTPPERILQKYKFVPGREK